MIDTSLTLHSAGRFAGLAWATRSRIAARSAGGGLSGHSTTQRLLLLNLQLIPLAAMA
jgi:hypothetical protein